MSAKRVHVFVSGRVQGVFYRQTAKQTAEELGLVGWVRNLADGRVEAVVEGDEQRVAKWIAWARQGPPGAAVQDVVFSEEAPAGEAGFQVLPTIA